MPLASVLRRELGGEDSDLSDGAAKIWLASELVYSPLCLPSIREGPALMLHLSSWAARNFPWQYPICFVNF
jgi:hypothetical protein